MTRAKRGFKARRRRKKLLTKAKGYYGSRKSRYRIAVHVVRRGLAFAFRDRRVKKREFRGLWITRINASCRASGIKYSQFIHGLKKAGIEMDRSVLADLALRDEVAFRELTVKARAALAA